MDDTLRLPLAPDVPLAARRRRRTLGELLVLLLMLVLLFLSCGWLSLIGTREPANADTRSMMRADYASWPFLIFQLVDPAIVEQIATDTGKNTEPLDLIASGTPPGWFWWTPQPTGNGTPTPPATATSAAPSATWTSSPTHTPSRTPTRTPSLTSTPTSADDHRHFDAHLDGDRHTHAHPDAGAHADPDTDAHADPDTDLRGGGPTNTPTWTWTPSNTSAPPTATFTPSWTPTYTATWTASPTATATPTATPSNTPTASPTPSNTPTNTATASNTSTFTPTPSNTPTNTLTPSNTPTDTPTATPTETPPATNTPLPGGTHYRSIGINAGVLYSLGSASVNVGTTTVNFGGGASLPANVGVGDRLVIGAETFYVLSRDSATQMTVQSAAAATHSAEAYAITRAYNTFQAWETDRQGDLVAENRLEIGVAYDDGAFLAATDPMVQIEGSVTDATHYLRITVGPGQGHTGAAGTGVVLDGQANTQIGIDVRDDFTRVEGLELIRFHHPTVDGDAAVFVRSATSVLFEGLLIHDFFAPAMSAYGARTSVVVGTVDSFTIRNSVIYDGDAAGVNIGDASDSITVQNLTVYGMAVHGVNINAGSMTVTNTISMGNGGQDFRDAVGGMTQSYNMSEDATAGGAGSLTLRLPSSQFVSLTAGSEDLHLKAGSDAWDAGTTLGGFSADIDGETRPQSAAWDMGADEYSGAPPTDTPTPTATATSSSTPTDTATPSNTPTDTATPSNTPTETATPSNTPTDTATPSNTPTDTATPSNTPTDTATPSNTPTDTATPSSTPTDTPTPSNTPTDTATPSNTPTDTPTPSNTPTDTATPSNTPTDTATPSNTPTDTPTPSNTPTDTPTSTATSTATDTPTPSNTPTPSPTATPYIFNQCDFNYRKPVTIDAGSVTADLANFPVLVSLPSDADLAADARNDGYDIVFTASDGTTLLSHEIETFDGATGELTAWVKVPNLSPPSTP
jgi:hypothetical protein